jgi:ATP-dependent Clp protease ATP-binding subunit ClpC
MFERYTERARRTIFFALDEAKAYRNSAIGSEHLLLALLRENNNILSQYAGDSTTIATIPTTPTIEEIRVALFGGPATGQPSTMDIPLSNEGRRILANGAEEAVRLSHKHIGTEHLLLGILREEDCVATRVLRKHGFTLDRLRAAVTAAQVESGTSAVAQIGNKIDSGSLQKQPMMNVGLLELSATEFLLVNQNRSAIPRIGESISIRETGSDAQPYRIQDIVWDFERTGGFSHLKTVKLKVAKEPHG